MPSDCCLLSALVVFFAASSRVPWYACHMAGFRKIASLLGTFDAEKYDTFEYTTPIVDMALYLPWLTRMFLSLGMFMPVNVCVPPFFCPLVVLVLLGDSITMCLHTHQAQQHSRYPLGHANMPCSAGGTLRRERIVSLTPLLTQYDVVVNCAGLGARWLVPDPQVKPMVGIVARVARADPTTLPSPPVVPQIDSLTSVSTSTSSSTSTSTSTSSSSWAAHVLAPASYQTIGHQFHRISLLNGEVAYIYPRRDCVILGGTYLSLPDATGPDDWRTAVDAATQRTHAAAIVERCALLQPELATAPVLDVRWGARPYRPTVRCEIEHPPQAHKSVVVHHYGHGGQGVLLSWGSAADAARLIMAHLQPSASLPAQLFQLLTPSKL